uniref:RRM domain-containing protein n=1 Tax=Syphacia muris TaxID=451379 RepID=A0A158R4Q2_9BILA
FCCIFNLKEYSIKSNNNKTEQWSVSDVAETYPKLCSNSALNCESDLKPVKVKATWSGELPTRNYVNPSFSKKVFVGGVPWDITEADLVNGFSEYGVSSIELPKKSIFGNNSSITSKTVGYAYMVFQEEDSIKKLLNVGCISAGEYHFKLSIRRGQESIEIRRVQIIPWVVSDSMYITDAATRTQCNKTVFVGALHGMLTAEMLYSIMDEVYGSVVFVCLDNDKYKYPIGSGRVSFSSEASFFQAIDDGFLVIKTSKFIKKIQIDPFLEYSKCCLCFAAEGTYFCRNRSCFNYFCGKCWECHHATTKFVGPHVPVVRQPKKNFSPSDVNRRPKMRLFVNIFV